MTADRTLQEEQNRFQETTKRPQNSPKCIGSMHRSDKIEKKWAFFHSKSAFQHLQFSSIKSGCLHSEQSARFFSTHTFQKLSPGRHPCGLLMQQPIRNQPHWLDSNSKHIMKMQEMVTFLQPNHNHPPRLANKYWIWGLGKHDFSDIQSQRHINQISSQLFHWVPVPSGTPILGVDLTHESTGTNVTMLSVKFTPRRELISGTSHLSWTMGWVTHIKQ